MATDGAMKKGAHAGNLIKEVASIVGGGRWWPSEYGAGWWKVTGKDSGSARVCKNRNGAAD